MSGLEKIFDLKNLRRAYRWILSNPEARYKFYFRDSYDAFALASDTHLKWIRREGLRGRYRPSHASKVLEPKPSGAMRPITLLTVEDQIVYQACVNLVADALKPKTINRYEKRVFSHLYAGKSSKFFYIRWQRSYRKFSDRIRERHSKGYIYVANFDLASFYDSIDHHVLGHFLRETGVDEGILEILLDSLKKWTSSTWSNGPQNIYHEHGIPQGPLASGMLSEVVLQHIDSAGEQGRRTVYLRYVDDIKILAKTEDELRQKLIELDIRSKEIGLFPQTAKINIRRIRDPNEEVKSVSRPPEASLKPFVDQSKLVRRILSMSRDGKINSMDVTRFKYLMARAEPTYRLNERCIKVLKRHPELASTICRYIAKYKKIPHRLENNIIKYLLNVELYHSVNGLLLRSCLGRLSKAQKIIIGRFCADRLLNPEVGLPPLQPTYKEALIAWVLKENAINFSQYKRIVFSEEDWWVRKSSVRELDCDQFGEPTYAGFINKCMRDSASEVARVAVLRLLGDGLKLQSPYGDVEITAKHMLKAARRIRSVGQPKSRINDVLSYILCRNKTPYDWVQFFSSEHQHAEGIILDLKRNRESNIDTFLIQLDSYCDLVTSQIYKILKPNKRYPNYGRSIKDSVLVDALPVAMGSFQELHTLRLESTTVHPRLQRTGLPTRRLKHRDFYKIRPRIADAFDEIEKVIILS